MKTRQWIISKGGINYIKESWKGELRELLENTGRSRVTTKTALVCKVGKYTLDELAIMAHSEGIIKTDSKDELLQAITEDREIMPEYKPSHEAKISALWERYMHESVNNFWEGLTC